MNTLTPFGQENVSHINDSFLEKCAKNHLDGKISKEDMFMMLIQKIYFDIDHPENINVIKDGSLTMVWNGVEWEQKDSSYVFASMLKSVKRIIASYMIANRLHRSLKDLTK